MAVRSNQRPGTWISAVVTPSADGARCAAYPQVESLHRSDDDPRRRGGRRRPGSPCGKPGRFARGHARDVTRTSTASVRGLVGLDDTGRDAAAVAHGVTVLAGPVANGAGLLAVHAATGRARPATTGGAGTAAHLARGRDVPGERVAHL